jgi:uncharacterized protein YkwD
MVRSRRALAGLAILVSLASIARGGPTSKEAKKREALFQALEDARQKALQAICDTSAYRDEDHGRSGQAFVDERVQRVRELWTAARPMLESDTARVLKLPPAKRQAFLEAGEQDLSPWERQIRRLIADREVLAANEALARPPKGGLPEKGVLPTEIEREQVRLTNEYRIMLGRPALTIDTRLVACARDHSIEMAKLNYFDHDSPVAEHREPSDRARNVGVVNCPVGENICTGYTSAKDAFEGWYHSAGHHRNMVDSDWRTIGVGRDGELWTQNYAGASTRS